MGQAAVGVGVSAVGVGKHIPLDTADLIHMPVGDHHFHVKMGVEDPLQAFCGHQAVADLAGGAAVVVVDGGPAHAVGDGQPTVLFQKAGENFDQPLGLGEVGEGVVDHDPVKFPVEFCLLHVGADHGYSGFVRIFPGGDPGHLRGDIDAGDGGHAPLQIVIKHHAGAAGHVQNVHSGANLGIVQKLANDCVTFDHVRVPI